MKNADTFNSGGAEVFTHEIARRWVERGNEVRQFSSAFAGCGRDEIVNLDHMIM